jgi:DNA-binding XRE family transcriptional regulator
MTVAEMIKLAQTIKTPNGEEMVVLPKVAFDELRRAVTEAEEEGDDIAIYDARKADGAGSAPLPAEVTMALLRGDRRIKAVRKWKGVTQQELSHAAGVTQGHLSDLETGRRTVRAETARTIAKALQVPLAWIEA